VFQFIDIFDALTSPRPYKPALSFDEVISILGQEINEGWLDPDLGAVFLELLKTRQQDFNIIQRPGTMASLNPDKAVEITSVNGNG
jgi:HD-GYP domain-containing protein (c-di-GMP phosphodiesterase class II)